MSISAQRRHLMICLVGASLLWSDSPVQAQKKLRWQFEPGDTYSIQIHQVVNSEGDVLGRQIKSSVDMTINLDWQVNDVDNNGNASITQTIRNLVMKTEMPGFGVVEIDTGSDKEVTGFAKTILDSVQPIVGTEIRQTMSNRGELLDVKLSADANAVLEKLPGGQVGSVLSEQGLKNLFSQVAATLPEKPVQKDSSWSGRFTADSPVGPLKMDTTYRYLGEESKKGTMLDKISSDITLSFENKSALPNIQLDIKEQDSSGVMYFDANQGQVVASDFRQNMTMAIKYGDKTSDQKTSTRMSMTVTKTLR